MLNRTLLITIN